MPAKPDCQVSEKLRPGSKLTSLQRLGSRFGRVGHVDQLERLAQLVADDPVGHPVGEGEDVAPDVLARAQLGRDLVEVRVVVLDVLGVLGRMPVS
jgi:hypothetical protein